MERNETEIIKEAHLLCPLGEAWYEQEGKFFIFSLDREEPELCRTGDIQLLYDISPTEIKKENITLAALRHELEACYRANTAFSFLLDGLDQSLEEVRQVVIKRANELCQDKAVQSFVHNKLLSRPIPKEADIEGAIKIASELGKEGQQALAIYRLIPIAFIDSANEDREKANEKANELIQKRLLGLDIERTVPSESHIRTTILATYQSDLTKVFQDLENKLKSCDVVITFYKQAPLNWLKERLRFYQVMQIHRNKPLRIFILSSIPQPISIKLPKNATWEILTNE